MTTYTYDEVVAAVTKIVDEKGRDYVYPKLLRAPATSMNCYYFQEDGAPSCLVGHWIAATGDEDFISAVKSIERTVIFPVSDIHEYLLDEGVDSSVAFEPDALKFLVRLQGQQDAGATWGYALDTAIRFVEEGQ